VLAFVQRIAEASPLVQLDTMATPSRAGALPLAVVGRGVEPNPASVRASGKTVVYIQANIHAGEVEGKEVAQLLLREVAAGEHATWLDSLVLLVAPIYNADGNERRLAHQPAAAATGPWAARGRARTRRGLRPETREPHESWTRRKQWSLRSCSAEYDPATWPWTCHTTKRHPATAYHLTYAPPLHPTTDSAIVQLLRNEWLPGGHETDRRADRLGHVLLRRRRRPG